MRQAQRTSFNTLDNWGHKTPTQDNWGHKTPTQSKRKRTGNKRSKGHGPEHTQYTQLQIVIMEYCKAPTPWLMALIKHNKHNITHTMHIETENFIAYLAKATSL